VDVLEGLRGRHDAKEQAQYAEAGCISTGKGKEPKEDVIKIARWGEEDNNSPDYWKEQRNKNIDYAAWEEHGQGQVRASSDVLKKEAKSKKNVDN